MATLRRWQLDDTAPFLRQLAADARMSQTNYADDQVWEVDLGGSDRAALALTTRYGGRVSLASIAPYWSVAGQQISLRPAYQRPPIVTAFSPGFIQAEAEITPTLALTAQFFALESQAVGASFTIVNRGDTSTTVRLDIRARVERADHASGMALIGMADGTYALSGGQLRRLAPVILLEDSRLIPDGHREPRIGQEVTIAPGGQAIFRWVHAGLESMSQSMQRARFWMSQDWETILTSINAAAESIPQIETGDLALDATIAASFQAALMALMRPTPHVAHSFLVATRQPERGFSAAGDGSDYGRGWSGLPIHQLYPLVSALAAVDPLAAQGILENIVATQAADATIDAAPGPAGQREGYMMPPLLARLARNIYHYSGELAFLERVYPPLLNFLNRWASADYDTDMDIMPEYQDERQTGYIFWPTFGMRQSWAQNANIRHFETPDMAANMLSEITCLSDIARSMQDPGAYELHNRLVGLQRYLEKLWHEPEDRYAYQDRDTDLTNARQDLLTGGAGDEDHILSIQLDTPCRLLVRVTGGASKAPGATLNLEGLGPDGERLQEAIPMDSFNWGYGFGAVSSGKTYTRLDRLRFDGLSRIYKVDVHTVDHLRLDINALMPLMLTGLPENRAAPLIKLLQDPAHFWQPSGPTIVSASDEAYDAASARGGGGVWLHWATLIGEGLLEHDHGSVAADIVRRLLKTQAAVLEKQGRFSEFYHATEPRGLGESGHIAGLAPLHLLLQVLGVHVMTATQVFTGGPHYWGQPVTIRRHGVVVQRSMTATNIQFPSGRTVTLPADADWQLVVDRSTTATQPMPHVKPILPPEPTQTGTTQRVIIEVQSDNSEVV